MYKTGKVSVKGIVVCASLERGFRSGAESRKEKTALLEHSCPDTQRRRPNKTILRRTRRDLYQRRPVFRLICFSDSSWERGKRVHPRACGSRFPSAAFRVQGGAMSWRIASKRKWI